VKRISITRLPAETVSDKHISEAAIQSQSNKQQWKKWAGTGGCSHLLVLIVHLGLGLVRVTRRGGASSLQSTNQNYANHYSVHDRAGFASVSGYMSGAHLLVVGVHLLGVLSLELLGLSHKGCLLLHVRKQQCQAHVDFNLHVKLSKSLLGGHISMRVRAANSQKRKVKWNNQI
jgi:hypothetical protein